MSDQLCLRVLESRAKLLSLAYYRFYEKVKNVKADVAAVLV